MRVFRAAMIIALLAGPAYAQSIPKYGEQDKEKSEQEKQADKAAEQAYKRSLGNIPDKAPADPWGNVRGDDAPKPVTKVVPSNKTKTGSTAN